VSGLGFVIDIAKSALAAQQYGISVSAHNIANVDTQGYSRQNTVYEAKQPGPYAGLLFGRGVETTEVLRTSDQFIENQLMQQQSSFSCLEQMENYMQIMEGLFSEDSGTSISSMLTEYWSSWQDLANNPSGAAERIALYEQSVTLTEQFNSLYEDLIEMENDLTSSLDGSIDRVNEITRELAVINKEIVALESSTTSANDLRDKRNALVLELSEYLQVDTFEQENGSLTIVAARGCTLVNGGSSYDLEMGGSSGDRVIWKGSGNTAVDITDYIDGGKMGGWLDMRDEVVAKYKLDLDGVAEEFIWAVNQQHSQGAGLEAFSSVTGTYNASDTATAIDSCGLSYADRIVDGGFRLWIYDSNGEYDMDATISIDASVTSIEDIAAVINAIDPGKISATIVNNKLQISGVNDYTFAFSDDTSNALAALGINTFFTGESSGSLDINEGIGFDKNLISTAVVTNNVGSAVPDTANDPSGTGTIVTSGHYTGAEDSTYEIQITTGGDIGVAEFQWRKDGGAWSSPVLITGGSQAIDIDGLSVTFIPGTYVANDIFSVEVTADSGFYGNFSSGDNTNAIAVADLQYESVDFSQWICDRVTGNTEGSITTNIESAYHALVGSMGITSQSISGSKDFEEAMVNELTEIRDSISAVSLDEEMTKLIEYQSAYAAASKLIGIADEMLNTLLSSR
jgi:flagellar hook-associated protein 1 FlgK